jgi:D-glycero-alpha-D-manno-heptose-7-phosphate kinase
MIISRTPFRVSFFGGGTDYPGWYLEHGGAVLATTIDKYCYLTCRYLPPFFEHKFRLVYSKLENRRSIDEIEHPSAREVIRHLGIERGLEIHHDADLPARSGLGSSSAFTVGLLHGLYALQGRSVGKRELAREAIHIEQEVLRETVGSQDQASTAHGGFNLITFLQSGDLVVSAVPVGRARLNELNEHLMLFYTGIRRTAETVARTYVDDIKSKRRQLRLMKDLTDEALGIVNSGVDLKEFGFLLHEAWEAKRSLSSHVSNSDVDDLYDTALRHGATGGKLLGAGGGGFFLVFAPPECHRAIRDALAGLVYVPFRFEFGGSQVIFMDREQDYQDLEHDSAPRGFRELDPEGDPAAVR